MEQEQRFLAALSNTVRFDRQDTNLTLHDADENPLLVFIAASPAY
jgi:hypothetical protein